MEDSNSVSIATANISDTTKTILNNEATEAYEHLQENEEKRKNARHNEKQAPRPYRQNYE